MCQFANMPMCQLAALSCRMVIGTLAYWQIGKLFNCNASFIFTFRIIAVLFFIDNKPLY